ncbi:MAG: RsmD family RNA methyltransferase [Bacteroidales bacterium]|nr:RsmD family RNA methyltransferase [Bacteroidales bacterium]MDD4209464.1 RsmD family RNA methyltransferase [Bacteroidales bacterium]
MRIISGNHKKKQIIAPQNLPVRPTTDLAKESIFNIINNYFFFDNINVLDLFAGTGNITYEFASRDALSVISIDNNPACTAFIHKTIAKLAFENVHIIQTDAVTFLQSCKQQFNIIFADPPYTWDSFLILPELVFSRNLLSENGFLIIEHPAPINYEKHPKFYEHRKYGKVNFSLFAENL